MQLIFTRKSRCKRIFSGITALIIVASSIAGAVIIAPVSVFALSAGGIQSTIASIIISLMLQCGVAPVNNSWVTALNTSYGYTIESAIESGLLTETTSGLVDSGLGASIESAAAYTDLGLSEIFTTTATDVGVVAAGGGANIAGAAINVGTLGTIGAFAGAAAVGVGLGVLIAHLGSHFNNYIKNAMAIDSSIDAMSYVDQYGGFVSSCVQANNYVHYYYYTDNIVVVASPSSSETGVNQLFLADYKQINSNLKERFYDQYGKFIYEQNVKVRGYTVLNGSNNVVPSGNIKGDYNNVVIFATNDEQKDYIYNLRSGNIQKENVISPDLIGPGGNQFYDSDSASSPGISSQIPEGGDMYPVNMSDYQNYMDNANNNTDNGETGQAIQGEGFEDLISPLIVNAPEIPDTPIIPDQPVDVPVVPDRPVSPIQPSIPDKPGITEEQLNEALQGATTIDLRSIFPFCIPFDLYNILLIFDTGENRKAPHIKFTFPITGCVIDVDLVVFDSVAGILRVLELILFIIGLAVATRKLIGAGGG